MILEEEVEQQPIHDASAAACDPPRLSGEGGRTSGSTGTFGQILKSSAMVGGSQVLNILISVVRTKLMAVMLGPAGLGLFGMFGSISNLTQTIAGLGVNSSGVRQIAAAVGSGDQKQVALTLRVLRVAAIVSGSMGALLLLIFSKKIATFTFGDSGQSSRIAWLSVAVFLTLVSASQTALIQGVRRIADLAKMQVLGALFGTILGIPLVFFYRERGVVPSLICVAAMTILTSWWYSRKLKANTMSIDHAGHNTKQTWEAARELVQLGVAFMISSLVTLGVSYSVRVMILHRLGLAATGVYQSAWTLGGMYVGFILQAMGADFYPRLTESIHDNAVTNRLVNEQAMVGLLLAGPGVLASISLAPAIIMLFYGPRFHPAVGVLRWICLGALLQVISFPMGYVIVAKAKQLMFIACETSWAIASMLFAWTFVARFGLVGAGIASFASYLFHWLMLYVIVYKINGFRWSLANLKAGAVTVAFVAIGAVAVGVAPLGISVTISAAVLFLSTSFSVRTLLSLFEPEQIPASVRRILKMIGLVPQRKGIMVPAS